MRLALLARVVAWLFGAGMLSAALYWAFLNTPDSNVPMLGASALLFMLSMLTGAYGVAVAAEVLLHGGWSRAHFRRGATALPQLLACVAAAALLFWATLVLARSLDERSGEISAWFIATFGWADVSGLLIAVDWLLAWVRWVLGPVAGLALFVHWRRAELGAPSRMQGTPDLVVLADQARRPARRVGVGLRALVLATVAFAVLVYLPWRYGFWPLSGLPPTWVEPAVAGARITVVLLLMTTGVALMMTSVVVPGRRPGGP